MPQMMAEDSSQCLEYISKSPDWEWSGMSPAGPECMEREKRKKKSLHTHKQVRTSTEGRKSRFKYKETCKREHSPGSPRRATCSKAREEQTVLQIRWDQSLSGVWLFATPWITASQVSLSITNSRSSPKLMCIELVMPSSHLILCRPLFLLPSIFASIRVFSKESALHISWPKYWSFSFNISPSNEHPGLISFRMRGWMSLQEKKQANTVSGKSPMAYFTLILNKGYFLNVL